VGVTRREFLVYTTCAGAGLSSAGLIGALAPADSLPQFTSLAVLRASWPSESSPDSESCTFTVSVRNSPWEVGNSACSPCRLALPFSRALQSRHLQKRHLQRRNAQLIGKQRRGTRM
jgi:hypothetical protein